MIRYQILPICPRCDSYHVGESHRLTMVERLLSLFTIRPYRRAVCGDVTGQCIHAVKYRFNRVELRAAREAGKNKLH